MLDEIIRDATRQAQVDQPGQPVFGFISRAPATLDDPVYVVIPSSDARYEHGPCIWQPRGTALPQRGAACLVVFDPNRRPWVAAWDGPTTFPAGGGGSDPTGPAGGVLSGTYPNPGFAVDMATQAELNAHTGLTTTAHGGIVASTDPRLSDARAPTAHTHPESDITNLVADLAAKVATSTKGVANGVASLDATGKVPSGQLPATSGAPTGAAGGDLAGTYPNPTVAKATSGIQVGTAGGSANGILFPTGDGTTPGAAKGRMTSVVPDWIALTLNAAFTPSGWVLDDTTRGGWFYKLDIRSGQDVFALYRIPAGAGAHTNEAAVLTVTPAGVLSVTGALQVNGIAAVLTNDARLTDARTPTAHTHPTSDITGLDAALATKVDTAGNGLTKTGTTVDVGAGAGISVAADSISVDVTTLPAAVPVSKGGTGATTAAAARIALGASKTFSQLLGAGTSFTVDYATHGITNTRAMIVQVLEETSGDIVAPNLNISATGTVTVTFAVAVAASSHRVTITGLTS